MATGAWLEERGYAVPPEIFSGAPGDMYAAGGYPDAEVAGMVGAGLGRIVAL
jgi:hypothetical protein